MRTDLVTRLIHAMFAGAVVLSGAAWAQSAPPKTETPAKSDAPDAEKALGVVLYDPLEGAVNQAPPSRSFGGPESARTHLEFVPGKTGNCVHFVGPNAGIKYPMSVIPFDEGTLEFWLSFDQAPSTFVKQRHVFAYHAGKEWFANYFILFHGGEKDWGKKLFFMVCDGDQKRNQIITSVADWKADDWHHIAVTWKLNAAEKCSMSLYIDRKLVEQKERLTILQDKETMAAAKDDPNYGFLWFAPPSGADLGFKVDEIRFYNVRRQYVQAQ